MKPSSSIFFGITDILSVNICEPLPKSSFNCHSQSGTKNGLFKALARALPNTFCGTGSGEVMLYTPLACGLFKIKLMDLTRSFM